MIPFIVEQQKAAVIQRLGKYNRVATAGLNFRLPFIDERVGEVNLRVRQLDVDVETKTRDNVFVKVIVSVQYFVLPEKIYEAFYKLNNADEQIKAFVFDVVRARVPMIDLDDVFAKKDDIADGVKSELAQVMDNFGYGILKALVTDIDPDQKVKEAMNEINAAQRQRIAAMEKGEAEKILRVKEAEAEAESKGLAGKGVADQRRAIVDGLRDSVGEFQKTVNGATPQDVMNLILLTQYFDTMKDIGAQSKSTTVFMPHSPGHVGDLTSQLQGAFITGDQVSNAIQSVVPPVEDPPQLVGPVDLEEES
jgi:regulator of protease activity HflC (stomatin/prohibitin superfamily)